MAECNTTTTAPTAPTAPINTATPPRSAAAKPNEAAYLSGRLHRHQDRLYMLHTLAEAALESLDPSTDTDTARATLTGMLEIVRADIDEVLFLALRVGDLATTTDTDATKTTPTAPAGMES